MAEVPCGALADRVSRRGALVAAGLLQALGYALWIVAPGFTGFALGFVLWGVSGSLASGAFNALLYDGLTAAGAGHRYGTALGRAEAAGLIAQVPVAGAASLLAHLGGHRLAGIASVVVCLAAAGLATMLPDRRPPADDRKGPDAGPGYLATLRAGVREAAVAAPVRAAIAAVAVLTAFDGLEEYFPLLAAQWGVPRDAIPLALLVVPVAGAVGAAAGGRMVRARARALAALLVAGAVALTLASGGGTAGIVGVALFYGAGRAAQVVADARMQERIAGPSRATVTSVAGLASELAGIALFAAWAAGGMPVVIVLALAAAAAVPWLLRGRRPAPRCGGEARGASMRP